MNRRSVFKLAATTLLVIGTLALLLFASLGWYRSRYAMVAATAFEAGEPTLRLRVLIATQGSEFKYALVERLVDYLKQRSVHIKVIDVSGLPRIQENEWSAIVVIHTWENWRPQPDAKAFLDRARDMKKIVFVTTSGSGREKMPGGIDVVSAASELRDVPTTLAQVTTRLDALLATTLPP